MTVEALEDRTMLTSMISINDVTIVEGDRDSGTTDVIFTVTRTGTIAGDLNKSVSIAYATQNLTAFDAFPQGVDDYPDYIDYSGSISFTADSVSLQQTATITIRVLGDKYFEEDEQFQITLSTSDPEVSITKAIGTATILNDDFPRMLQYQRVDPTNPSSN
ncbi:MAG: hypothetical protein KDA74_22305, partial [Planctomycetaceae bacterium]|nr:hypothetical protein [Planctomycetaceae bacterium]